MTNGRFSCTITDTEGAQGSHLLTFDEPAGDAQTLQQFATAVNIASLPQAFTYELLDQNTGEALPAEPGGGLKGGVISDIIDSIISRLPGWPNVENKRIAVGSIG